jgi:hypothetical protein
MLANGTLPLDDLTDGEFGQVTFSLPPGWGPTSVGVTPLSTHSLAEAWLQGNVAVYFDPTVFCAACESGTITLQPPGWGPNEYSEFVISGNAVTSALPPLELPDGGLDHTVHVGSAYVPGMGEIDVPVIIDGSDLEDGMAGLPIMTGAVSVRGITFRDFPGTAVVVACDAAGQVELLANFMNNSNDVQVTDCAMH